jgi:integrase/recombinase XerD
MNAELLDKFCQDCQIRNIRDVATHVSYIKQYIELLESKSKNPILANKDDLKDYLSLLRQRGLKQASIDKAFSCLSSFYMYLVDEDIVSSNLITPFRRRYLRKYKDDNGSETRQIISVEQASLLVNSTLNSRDRAILTLLFKTGIRRGELCKMDVGDIDHRNMTIRLKPTAKRSNRLLFFDNEAEEALQAWLQFRVKKYPNDIGSLFLSRLGSRISGSEVERIVKKHATRTGIHNKKSKSLEDHFSPHCCRHWFTTHLIRAGMPRDFVKELRGDVRHDAIDIYNHIDRKELRESYLAHIPQLGI